ncbi:glycosyl transferase family 1 [Phaeospirillum tilakii]|uniref:Glycosyl transferase family 1 n=1 Tax=Phaeospirillum tilakii TaxID=741673 RepID=A0ABW5CDF4_9PROT
MTKELSVVYLVHDLGNGNVERRVRTFLAGGGRVRLLGFRRGEAPVAEVAGVAATDLGRTHDSRLALRAVQVIRAAFGLAVWGRACRGADLVVARNLEMLLLAWLARRLFAPRAGLVYELIDIHSLMVGDGPLSVALRGLERWLLRDCGRILISSPAFAERYLDQFQLGHPPVVLVENKVYPARAAVASRPPGPPWRIGWFGNLRCRRSLDVLIALARRFSDTVEIDLRGGLCCEALASLPDEVRPYPNIVWHGGYRGEDLADIYAKVHFCWAIDYYQEGLNSSWLLPNRLYESCLHGSVPIAVASVETGRWLARHDLGVRLDESVEAAMIVFLSNLTPAGYVRLTGQLAASDPRLFRLDESECRDLIEELGRSVSTPGATRES